MNILKRIKEKKDATIMVGDIVKVEKVLDPLKREQYNSIIDTDIIVVRILDKSNSCPDYMIERCKQTCTKHCITGIRKEVYDRLKETVEEKDILKKIFIGCPEMKGEIIVHSCYCKLKKV